MSGRLAIAIAIAALAVGVAACGSEPVAPGSASPSATVPSATGAADATASGSARPSDSAGPTASAGGAATRLEPSDANVSRLLEGGAGLSALPTRATDADAPFDPSLRAKLAPAKPTPP